VAFEVRRRQTHVKVPPSLMKNIPCLVALDQGTTSSRTVVFDTAGAIRSLVQQEFTQHYPRPGWVEHDAAEIWASQRATLGQAIEEAREKGAYPEAIGITNQRETLIVWERASGQPLTRAIVWQDRRTSDYCSRLRQEGHEADVTQRTGLKLDPYFTGTKLAWLLRKNPAWVRRAEAGDVLAGTVDTWLLWNLTGGSVHATDASNASRTLLFNLESGDWDESMLHLFGVPRAMLPEIRDSSGKFGYVKEGLPGAGLPITGVAGDQQAALFGQACFEPGMAKNTYGTGCFLLMQTGTNKLISQHNLLTTVAWRIKGETHYALEGGVFVAGAAVQWVRDELRMVKSASELSTLAGSVPDAGGMILVPAFAGLGAPHWDPYARGAMLGLTRGSNRAQLCRAVLESIALQSADLITAMEQDAGQPLKELRVDGGAAASDVLMQIQADLLDKDVVRPRVLETTALGAAYLAGLGVGIWSTAADISAQWQPERSFRRAVGESAMQRLQHDWARAVKRAKAWEEAEADS